MNRAQRRLVGAGAVVAALFGFAAVRELGKPGANCRDEMIRLVDGPARSVTVKSRVCE